MLFEKKCAFNGAGVWQGILARIECPLFSKAQFTIGRLFYAGTCDDQDFKKAIQWFRKSADNGHALAQYALGMIYDLGQGIEPDLTEAREWFGKACKQGFEQSCRAYQSLENKCTLEEDLKYEWLCLNALLPYENARY